METSVLLVLARIWGLRAGALVSDAVDDKKRRGSSTRRRRST
jgi:uridine phosphorylase